MWATGGIGDKIILTPSRPAIEQVPTRGQGRSGSVRDGKEGADGVREPRRGRSDSMLAAEKVAMEAERAERAAAEEAVAVANAAAAQEELIEAERAAAEAAANAAAISAAVAEENKRHAAAVTQAKVARVVVKQQFSSQVTTMRAIAHRAAADMERYRMTAGREQEENLHAYWQSWAGHMTATRASNDRLLAFTRASAAASATAAGALNSANAGLVAIMTGEAMTAVPVEGPASGVAPSNSLAAPSTTFGAFSSHTTAPSLSAGGAGTAASDALVRRADAGVSRHSLSIGVVAASLADLNTQTAGALGDLAAELSRDVCGDPDGALGKRGDGKHGDPGKLHRFKGDGASIGELATPRTLGEVCAMYEAYGTEILREGNALVEMLNEVGAACSEAYITFESTCHGLITGSKLFKSKDLWMEELRYRRACRVLLAAKGRFLGGMATLFERYRRLEQLRSDGLAMTAERYAQVTARVFDRVTAKAVAESVKSLNTHGDFCRLLEEDTRHRIDLLRANQASARAKTAAAAEAAAAAVAGVDAAAIVEHGRAGRGGYGAYAVVPPAIPRPNQHLKFTLDAAPAVISPLCSPVVLRCGMLLRQTGIIKQWKQCVGVLTRDGYLHVFQTDSDDLATHPDVLMLVLRWSSERYAAQPRFASAHPPGAAAVSAPSARPAAAAAGAGSAAVAPAPPPQAPQQAAGETAAVAAAPISPLGAVPEGAGSAEQSTSSLDNGPTATPEAASSPTGPRPQSASAASAEDPAAASVAAAAASAAAASAGVSPLSPPPGPPSHSPAAPSPSFRPSASSSERPLMQQLPPPALPPNITAAAAQLASNVMDLQSLSEYPDLLSLVKKADAAPSATYQITPQTRFLTQPAVHMHAFELSDKVGWFGMNKLCLRATCLEDAAEWMSAGEWMAQQLAAQQTE